MIESDNDHQNGSTGQVRLLCFLSCRRKSPEGFGWELQAWIREISRSVVLVVSFFMHSPRM
jgi:hypothetical protein